MDRGVTGLDPERMWTDFNCDWMKACPTKKQREKAINPSLSLALSLLQCLHLTHPPLLTLSFLFCCRSVIPCSITLVTCRLFHEKVTSVYIDLNWFNYNETLICCISGVLSFCLTDDLFGTYRQTKILPFSVFTATFCKIRIYVSKLVSWNSMPKHKRRTQC